MQATSAFYAPYADIRRSELRVSFRLVDTTAHVDATAAASEETAGLNQLAQTHDGTDGMSAKWATFETKGWKADGSCSLIPDDLTGHQTGWWSNLSGADGLFASAPTLTFTFSSDHASIGFTVIFDDKADRHPLSMTISAYDAGDVLINTETVTVDSTVCIVQMPADNYRKIVLSFGSTQEPYQRVRVAEVIFGVVQYFNEANLTGGSLLNEVSPTAEFLPANEMQITFDNTDRKYNITNPDGLFEYLQQGQALDADMVIGNEPVSMGRFYFTESSAEDGAMTAQVRAHDRFYQLEQSACRLGTTGTWTLAQAVAAIITDSGQFITTVIPAAIASRTINKCIPLGTSHREALRLAAQAARCTCFFDRIDQLVFVEMVNSTPVDALDEDNLYSPAKAEVSRRINTVKLNVRDDFAGTETVFTAQSLGPGETAQVWSVDNPLGNQDTADWLLAMAQHRITFLLAERGNPAREIGDTVTVSDVYGQEIDTVVLRQEFLYDGTLAAVSRARRLGL